MSSLGNTIEELSTTIPLNAGSSWTSSPVVLGQYNSLVIMVRTDQDSTLQVQWSGDNGINFDASDNYNIVDNVTKRIVITTQQKVIRLVLTNGSGVNQTELRLFTYGVTTNNSSLVSLVSSIDIENLISGLNGKTTQTTQPILLSEYNFASGNPALGNCINNVNPTIFADLQSNGSGGASAIWGVSDPIGTINRYLFLRLDNVSLSEGLIQGAGHRIRGGETLICRFVASFSVDDSTAGSQYIGLLPTPGSSHIIQPTSCPSPTLQNAAFGWYLSGSKTNDNFGIIYGNGQVVTRPNFNRDKCDGNSVLPLINFTDPSKPNLFQIEVTAGGNYRFSIMSSSENKFITVHEVRNLDSTLVNLPSEACFTIYSLEGTGHSVGNTETRCVSAAILTDLPVKIPTSLVAYTSWEVAVSGGTVNPVALRNKPTFGTSSIWSPVFLKTISITSSGSTPVTVSLVTNITTTGGTWGSPSAVTPTLGYTSQVPYQINSTATIGLPLSTTTIYQFELGANDKLYQEFDVMTPLLYGFRPVLLQVTSKGTSDVRITIGLSS